jgi:hypothetical protein
LIRDDSHWRESNGRHYAIAGLNPDRTEKNVSDDVVSFHANEGEHCFPAPAEGVYEVGFIRTTKGLLIDPPYCCCVLWLLRADQ